MQIVLLCQIYLTNISSILINVILLTDLIEIRKKIVFYKGVYCFLRLDKFDLVCRPLEPENFLTGAGGWEWRAACYFSISKSYSN